MMQYKEVYLLELLPGRIERNPLRRLYFQRVFRNRIELLLSAQTIVGQVLAILVFVLSIGSLIIYFINSRDNSVKLSKLLSIVISTWFTAAGFLHLTFPLPSLFGQVENSGDPWLNGRNSQSMSYFEAIYLVTATMSTVGFGDIVAKTALGRTFIVFFTLGSLVILSPFLLPRFIVVCGNITVDSVTAFLRNFLRHRSGEINMDIVFLGEAPPSLELETLLKCSLSYTTFVCGSALTFEDLKRVSMEYAEACLILANPLCSDLHAEDNSNIMRVLSIKNYSSHTRVIIELLQSHNKGFLSKIPAWNWSTGDNIICFAELKLGFIAQGCLVPGLCTFLTTLFIEQNQKVSPKYPWQKYFLNSLKNKILTQRLSNDFVGMTFPAVSRSLILNPSAQVKLSKDTLGFFIAESPQAVKRAFFYCSTCHKDVYTPELIEQCDCKNNQQQARAVRQERQYTFVVAQFNSLTGQESELQRDLVIGPTASKQHHQNAPQLCRLPAAALPLQHSDFLNFSLKTQPALAG
ncbi:hypothetical protein ACRRTK_012877 [Alexandromys fortis]